MTDIHKDRNYKFIKNMLHKESGEQVKVGVNYDRNGEIWFYEAFHKYYIESAHLDPCERGYEEIN
jgi:hypothetical protein